jgi:hypothetical protein
MMTRAENNSTKNKKEDGRKEERRFRKPSLVLDNGMEPSRWIELAKRQQRSTGDSVWMTRS